MPGPRTVSGRGSAAPRPLWRSALWSGVTTAVAGSVLAIIAVAICWLPASGASGSANSTVRAGLLTFLAALHGGITVDGAETSFLPLGMLLLVAAIAWRAGAALAGAAESDPPDDDLGRLTRIGLLQIGAFAATCGGLAAFARLGTSDVQIGSTVVAAILVFTASGGAAFVRGGALGDEVADRLPPWATTVARIGAAVTAVYLISGTVLVAGSLIAHHERVEMLSRQVGGGWSGVPVLLLGLLAVPNAALAGASYLAGPGFAVGAGDAVTLSTPAHGSAPAFPLLGALPAGPGGAPTAVWALAGATPVLAGIVVVVLARRTDDRLARIRYGGGGVIVAALLLSALSGLAGGGIGAGRLQALGPAPLRVGPAVLAATALAAALALAAAAAIDALRARSSDADADAAGRSTDAADRDTDRDTDADVEAEPSTLQLLRAAFGGAKDDGKPDQLAG